ncbi:16S rRNA (guanine(966)-N(2))-methyltransferase RsmD [Halalkalibacter hemicellulosilyticus]|uniref:Ribosomal RNA small subunit methyltransferase D n=1 Tax=Halalkalibacter hemicellulosilyticusJCM 9152 TaxID=1236971 RepID=W4QBR7_9BACI|nr:16S rRNA (guanine(966)-N(2))-methyltransferase RsmD [Halalkalibacter hemicellulosilyticus]GAE29128.1 ribosomal RNA small subunit methyltransferase D [Halalkalibacter hemicellulosilyticusJCM 9152]
MRVISGLKKGLSLKAVPGSSTRPTTDKVKEAIFNIVGPYFDGGSGLDLYAGTGGLGIEALSRGMDNVIFVDQNKKAISIIKDNLQHCSFSENAEVYRNDANRALKALIKRERSFDLIFLDPPYAQQQLANELSIIVDFHLIRENGMIVCESGLGTTMPEHLSTLERVRQEAYGDTLITIYRN